MEWEDHQACKHDPKVRRKLVLTQYLATERAKIKVMRERRNKCLDKLRRKEMMADINEAVAKLKPYTLERSEINKTISKFPMCEKRRYRFLKEPKGVMPTVIQNLLDARKHTRKVDMAKVRDDIKELELEDGDNTKLIASKKGLLDVLNKRQLAFKVSANSMYGAMGVRRGYLPFMPGAMCTTYMGRENITRVAEELTKNYNGTLVYGDTDSNYIQFHHLESAAATWDYALEVADKISALFPAPIRLEFEEEIYAFFLILSKKRYMYRKCLRDGVVDDKIGKKGVLLARRDNSKFVRDVYEGVVGMIASHKGSPETICFVLDQINQMCSGSKPYTDFIITKSIGNHGGLIAQSIKDKPGKALVGDYTVPVFLKSLKYVAWEDQIKKKKELADRLQDYKSDPRSEDDKEKIKEEINKDFYLLCLPAQVQLAERMRRRGKRVDPGTRLEYVVTNPEKHTAKQYEKIESAEYMARHRDIIRIDYMYYLKALVNPLDQVLDVAFKDEKKFKAGFTMSQYKFRWKLRDKMLQEVQLLSTPKIVFHE